MSIEKSLIIIGFGNQAQAWALNLRDSGYEISIALRENSPSALKAKELGFNTLCLDQGPQQELYQKVHDIALLIPDDRHLAFFQEFKGLFPKESRFIYAHGASLLQYKLNERFNQFEHLLLAPKAIASELRFQYQTNGKLGACFSVEHALKDKNKARELLFRLAKDLGITGGPYETSFSHEAYADLFSEQSLLCGLLPYAAKHSFQQLRTKGISEEIAYMECWLEVKLIADAMVKMGPYEFFQLISPNALIGSEQAQNLIFDKEYQGKLERLCEDIWSGGFFQNIENSDIPKLRETISERWKSSELQAVHDKLKKDLIGN